MIWCCCSPEMFAHAVVNRARALDDLRTAKCWREFTFCLQDEVVSVCPVLQEVFPRTDDYNTKVGLHKTRYEVEGAVSCRLIEVGRFERPKTDNYQPGQVLYIERAESAVSGLSAVFPAPSVWLSWSGSLSLDGPSL